METQITRTETGEFVAVVAFNHDAREIRHTRIVGRDLEAVKREVKSVKAPDHIDDNLIDRI